MMIMPYDFDAYEKLIPGFWQLLSSSASEKGKGI